MAWKKAWSRHNQESLLNEEKCIISEFFERYIIPPLCFLIPTTQWKIDAPPFEPR